MRAGTQRLARVAIAPVPSRRRSAVTSVRPKMVVAAAKKAVGGIGMSQRQIVRRENDLVRQGSLTKIAGCVSHPGSQVLFETYSSLAFNSSASHVLTGDMR